MIGQPHLINNRFYCCALDIENGSKTGKLQALNIKAYAISLVKNTLRVDPESKQSLVQRKVQHQKQQA
jgi:hypothetical protein